MELEFRAPGARLHLAELLERASPGIDSAAVLREGRAAVAGRTVRRDERVAAGAPVVVQCSRGERDVASPRPAGVTAGFVALAPEPPWRRGTLDASQAGSRFSLSFEVRAARGGVAEVWLAPDPPCVAGALLQLSRAGMPVLGDARLGGILVGDGLRVRIPGDEKGAWWPVEPVFPGDDGRTPRMRVSRATARALQAGHPWVLRDAHTGDPGRFRPGTPIEIVDEANAVFGLALSEGPGRVSARVWKPRPREGRGAGPVRLDVEQRVAAALERRRHLLRPPAAAPPTEAYRLVHAEGDGLPGLAVDRLGPLLRVLVSGRASDGFRDRALHALRDELSGELGRDPPIVLVLHLRERPRGWVERVRRVDSRDWGHWAEGADLVIRERGIAFRVDPGLGSPERSSPGVGLYLDQRETRDRLARLARGGRWLNLFAHTGAFSLALLAGGAREVVSVDLSGAYLRWLEENLALNPPGGDGPAIDPGRHLSLRRDARRFLAEASERSERYDGIVVDPPTAAAAGRRYWSVSRQLPPLVEQAFARLAPGGLLFVSRTDRDGGRSLADLVRAAATRSGVELESIEKIRAGADFPALPHFPEGDPFRAVLVRTAGDARRTGSKSRKSGA